jgi:predicted ATPase
MITSIRLQNFKAHRDTTLSLGRLTVLVGPNGTGKTSVLEALLGIDRIMRSGFDTVNYGASGKPVAALHNSARLGAVAVAVTGDDHGTPWQISFDATPDDSSQSNYHGSVSAAYGDAPLTPVNQRNVRDPKLVDASLGEVVLHHFNAEAIARPSVPQIGTPRVSDDGGNTATVLASLKLDDDERFPRIEAELRKIVSTVERIRMRRVGSDARVFDSIFLDFRGAPGLPAYLASEGTLVTLALLTSICTASGPRTILLDDLGISLHPVAQMELVRQIKRLLDERPDVQIVATTHSSFILDELDADDVQVFAVRSDGSVATRPLSQHPEADRMKGSLSAGQIWTLDPEERWVIEGD